MGSSKKQTVGYKYKTGAHLSVGMGPWDAVNQIKYGDKTAWTGVTTGGRITIDAPSLYGGDSSEGGIAGDVDVLMGLPDQARNDYLLAQLGEYCPAFRGVVSLVFRSGFYWGNSAYYKTVTVRGTRIFATDGGSVQWYPGGAAIPSASDAVSAAFAVSWTLVGGAPAISDGWTVFVPESSPTSQTRVYSSGSGGTDTVTLRVTGLVELRLITGGEAITDRVTKGGTPGAAEGYNLYKITISSPAATYWLNTGTSTPVLSALDEEFDVEVDDGATVEVAYSTVDGAMIGTHQNLTVAASSSSSIPLLDMNPIHIIREVLTSTRAGLGEPTSKIDDDNFRACALTLFDEGFGLSYYWTGDTTAEEFIQDILDTIDARLYVHPRTGLWTLKLIRDDYSLTDLPVLDGSVIKRIDEWTTPDTLDLPNSVAVTYWDPAEESTVTVQVTDPAGVASAGVLTSLNRDYSAGVCNANLALRLAQRDLIASGAPLPQGKLSCTSAARDLLPGDPFVLDYAPASSDQLVMRVVSTKRGGVLNRRVELEVVQDVFTLDGVASVSTTDPAWTDQRTAELDTATPFAIEAPYYEIVQRLGETQTAALLAATPDAGMVLATAGAADNAINAIVYADGDAWADYADLAPTGTLTEAADYLDDALAITWTSTPDTGSHIQIDEEVMRFDGLDSDGRSLVGRGCVDTVPGIHAVDAVAWAWDAAAATDEIERAQGEAVDITLQLRNNSRVGALSAAVEVTLDARAVRPYPPGNVTINGGYYPTVAEGDITLAFATRNRVSQSDSLIDFMAGNVTPEEGTTYRVDVFDTATETAYSSVSGATSSPIVLPSASVPPMARIELWAVRDGWDSWQPFAASFAHAFTITVDAPNGGDLTTYLATLSTDTAAAVEWYISGGSLPAGVALVTASETGEIVGTPATAGDYTVTVRGVSDASTSEIEVTFTIGTVGSDLPLSGTEVADGTGRLWTAFGGAAISSGVTLFGGPSLALDGSGDYLLTAAAYWELDAFRTGDDTIELWAYFNSLSGTPHLYTIGTAESNRVTIYVSGSKLAVFIRNSGTYSTIITDTVALVTGQWYHVALTLSSGTWRLFRNGEMAGSSTYATRLQSNAKHACIGWQPWGGLSTDYLNGYVAGARVTRNVALYAAAFTPPVAVPVYPEALPAVSVYGSLPSGSAGVAYSEESVLISGTAAPFSVSVISGALPAGWSAAAVSGPAVQVSGPGVSAGSYLFTLRVTDDDGAFAEIPLALDIV